MVILYHVAVVSSIQEIIQIVLKKCTNVKTDAFNHT